MSKEEIGITASKKDNFSEWYTQVVLKSKLADYAPVKGLIVLRPDGYSIWESLKSSLDKKLGRRGVGNGFLPTLIPESLLAKEKKHFAGFDPEVFWVTHSGKEEIGDKLALRPTSETLAYTMYSRWIKSWRDLPLRINFWNTALRAEIKATKPFLRTSEFLWQEGHTVHTDSKDAKDEADAIMNIYIETVENELAIPVITGRKSEKEQFVGAEYTITMESMMPDGRALQMGTSHFLGQNFSKPFEVKYADKDNVEKFAWQTSWGVSWRLLGAMIMVHGDDHGLILPPKMAPIQTVIIPIYYSKQDEMAVISKAEQMHKEISGIGVRVHIDRREGMTPGFKYHDWEMRGVPLRIEIGPRDLKDDKSIFAKRTGGKEKIPLKDTASHVKTALDTIQSEMLKAARTILYENMHDATTYQEFKSILGIKDDLVRGGGFLRSPWCGKTICEDAIKEETGAEIRVIPNDEHVLDDAKCVYCGKDAEHMPLFARGY
ncbi:MAG: Proline--tRNA ligase [Cenarchaeum symbiont of Oopsacas minuta]|nr:Proline--tRNA ligase [Cenarchaeum symbiont of Oopsacas minuta]